MRIPLCDSFCGIVLIPVSITTVALALNDLAFDVQLTAREGNYERAFGIRKDFGTVLLCSLGDWLAA